MHSPFSQRQGYVCCWQLLWRPATTKERSLLLPPSVATPPKQILKKSYVNADTLLEKYEYFKDIRVKLEEKAKKAQADLQSRSNAFQREVADYQQKAPTMSAADRQSTEERLARKQDELARHNQNASASFAQEEASENEKLYSRITEYLKKHAKENGYKLVLTYSTSNPAVLYADESLEITDEVLAALNSEYAKEKK